MGRTVRVSNPGGGERFGTRPGLTQPRVQWVTALFPRGKAAEAWRWPPTQLKGEVNERVQLQHYFPFGPSWSVVGWPLPLPSHTISQKDDKNRRDLGQIITKSTSGRSPSVVAGSNPAGGMDVCVLCVVRGLCNELITRPEESYRLWCVVVCDLETTRKRRP